MFLVTPEQMSAVKKACLNVMLYRESFGLHDLVSGLDKCHEVPPTKMCAFLSHVESGEFAWEYK